CSAGLKREGTQEAKEAQEKYQFSCASCASCVPSLSTGKAVTLAVDCDDVLWIFRIVFDFLTQPRDMNIDGSCQRNGLIAPHFLEQFVAREHDAFPLDEVSEQPAFALAKIGGLALLGYSPFYEIDVDTIEFVRLEFGPCTGRCASQKRFDARLQFRCFKRL